MSETTPLISIVPGSSFPEINYATSLKNVAKSSVLNLLLVFIPLGIIAGHLEWSAGTTFALNFLAIVPLAKLLGLATEDLALRVGQTVGGLLNGLYSFDFRLTCERRLGML
jgi:Ca2+:H+ antiporter